MRRVKIYGAGSVGNHLAHAARLLGWETVVCDLDQRALDRMRREIYPTRYGQWDGGIQLYSNDDAPTGDFDMIFVGTPPDRHMEVAFASLEEKPRILVIEKPVCAPGLERLDEFAAAIRETETRVFVGYNHVVAQATRTVEDLLRANSIGCVESIEVEFREHWQGIFAAHLWLNGPSDSYLGHWRRGGGASGEHSHALNLWQHFAHAIGAGRVLEIGAMLNYVRDRDAEYDAECFLQLRTETGLMGRVVQDVVSVPSRKRAYLQGSNGSIEWVCGYSPGSDAVILRCCDDREELHRIPKQRSDDFVSEMVHLEQQLGDGFREASPMGIERGLETMLVLRAAHDAEREGRRMVVDYSQGYTRDAIRASK